MNKLILEDKEYILEEVVKPFVAAHPEFIW